MSDLISRQAVLSKIKEVCFSEEWVQFRVDKGSNGQRDFLIDYIEQLPSITPQPKMGHWITQWNMAHQKEYYYCSECREEFSYDGETGIKMNDYNYCPNCGSRMVEPQESEDKE